ncbi:MAG: cyclic pyranopterin monophosphate synthase MoaC [Helicobacteraceae bacterium]|jgi:cyclic pyranopterin phosphate synthase|nr:cyclic pyranopterin monophosphate synthase MoaC [Helicobacteraceae bacterium]
MPILTHLDDKNRPQMVDVSAKTETNRAAIASGEIAMSREAFDAIVNARVKKGPVLQTAIIAAIMGAKKTSEIIPMCHPINLTNVSCDVEEFADRAAFRLVVTAKTRGATGVEMEALSGAAIGLLTIYDMVKAIDKTMTIGEIRLEKKDGGKSGLFERKA